MFRSLVANLGAANHFTIEHLDDPKNQQLIEKAKIIYTAVTKTVEKLIIEAIILISRVSSIQYVQLLLCVYVNMLIHIINYSVPIYRQDLFVNISEIV